LTIHCVAAASACSACWIAGNAMFTTEPSRKAMLDPTMVATSVSHFPLCDKAASKVGVASMTPASHGGRMNPTIGCSRRRRSWPVRATLAHTVGNLLVVAATSQTTAFRSALKCRSTADIPEMRTDLLRESGLQAIRTIAAVLTCDDSPRAPLRHFKGQFGP
jgi:hypothetical protein